MQSYPLVEIPKKGHLNKNGPESTQTDYSCVSLQVSVVAIPNPKHQVLAVAPTLPEEHHITASHVAIIVLVVHPLQSTILPQQARLCLAAA